jgi:hypothetical protein
MSTIKRIKAMQKQVAYYLHHKESLRDDDKLLVANIWYQELLDKNIDSKKFSAFDFLQMYADDTLTNSDIITRARRKVQEENPQLRGKNWAKRHKEAETFRK